MTRDERREAGWGIKEFQARMAGLGVDAAGTTPAEFGALFKAEVEMWAKVVKAAKVVLD